MSDSISAKQLRASLPEVVERVRKGARFTVIYRSRPAFQIIPIGEADEAATPLEEDPLFEAEAVGASADGLTAAAHDVVLFPK